MNAALFPDLTVNGELVPHASIAAETQNHDAPKGKPGIAWRKAANAMAIRTLLLQEARSRGVVSEPQEVGPQRFETDEEAQIRTLLEEAVDTSVPSPEEVHAEWLKNPDRFRAPPLWEVSHILFACDVRSDDDSKHAYERAHAVLPLIHADPKCFTAMAAQHSQCGSKSSGGALGQLGPHDTVPEFETALRDLTEGEVTAAPVLTRHGWHIIRMDAIAEGATLPYDAVKPKISAAMEKAAWAKGVRSFVNELVAAAEISGASLQSH